MRAFRIGTGVLCAAAWLALLAAAPAAFAEPKKCSCRYAGQSYEIKTCACIDRGDGPQLACCTIVLNNTSWTFTGKSCPKTSEITTPAPRQTSQLPHTPMPVQLGAIPAER